MTDNKTYKAIEKIETMSLELANQCLKSQKERIAELEDIINRQKVEIKELRSNESRWFILATHFRRIEELGVKLFKLTNMNLEEIIEYFAKGYTLVPPEPPNFNELAKFAEEMTEDENDKN